MLPIDVTPPGTDILDKLVHSLKVLSGIAVKPPLKITLDRFEHPWNTPEPIDVTVSGIVTDVIEVLLANTAALMDVILLGIVIAPPGPVYPCNTVGSTSLTSNPPSSVVAFDDWLEITQTDSINDTATKSHPIFVPLLIDISPYRILQYIVHYTPIVLVWLLQIVFRPQYNYYM